MDAFTKIYEHFGWQTQKRKLQEEVDELKDEIMLYEEGRGNIEHLIEELVDVYVLLNEIAREYEITEEEVTDMINIKVDRTLERIESGYYD